MFPIHSIVVHIWCCCNSGTGDDEVDVSDTASEGVAASKIGSKKSKARSMLRLVVNAFGDVEYPDKDVSIGTL